MELNNKIALIKTRLLAMVIDLALAIVVSIFPYFLSLKKENIDYFIVVLFFFIISNIIAIIYTDGRTIGEVFSKIKVVRINSLEMPPKYVILFRTFIYWIFLMSVYFNPYYILSFVLYVFPIFIKDSPFYKKQVIWDVITKTTMVNSQYNYADQK